MIRVGVVDVIEPEPVPGSPGVYRPAGVSVPDSVGLSPADAEQTGRDLIDAARIARSLNARMLAEGLYLVGVLEDAGQDQGSPVQDVKAG